MRRLLTRLRDILGRSSLAQARPEDLRHAALGAVIAAAACLVFPAVAAAQAINLDLGTGGGLTDR
ncbi:MAG: hypothetical protein JO303_03490, partial [Caulobacteraceae bacterium]|nr:hypothetical protein [Caulobacteraceae bacterium]